jgi:hypothetical protein
MTTANTSQVAVQGAPAAIEGRDASTSHSSADHARSEAGWASRISTPTYALAVSTTSLLATGVVLGVRGRRELDRLDAHCDGLGCDHGDVTRGRRLYVAADVMLGVSAGFLLATLWSYFARDRESDPRSFGTAHDASTTRYLPSLSVTPQRGMLAWSASF